jgi:hypothetical protein
MSKSKAEIRKENKERLEKVVVILKEQAHLLQTMTSTMRKKLAQLLMHTFKTYECMHEYEKYLKQAFAFGLLLEEEYALYVTKKLYKDQPHKFTVRSNLQRKVNYHWKPIIDIAFNQVSYYYELHSLSIIQLTQSCLSFPALSAGLRSYAQASGGAAQVLSCEKTGDPCCLLQSRTPQRVRGKFALM